MAAPAVITLDTGDIQGLVVRGHGALAEARFLLLKVADAELARRYLQRLCGRERPRINTAAVSPEAHAIQVAFTDPGLRALGVPGPVCDTFARELVEGMDHPIRAESLGDRSRGEPSPLTWSDRDVHVLLMVYAKDADTLKHVLGEERAIIEAGAFDVVHEKTTIMLPEQKEHFGWRDGLSMPSFLGVPHERPRKKPQPSWTEPLQAGEIVLGYPNEYKAYSESPTAALADDPAGHLAVTADGTHKDLGRNGTYLVYRELLQHVSELWSYLQAASDPVERRADKAIELGAKMVGRWPGGAPLTMSPEHDDPRHKNANAFRYVKDDNAGTGCPIGAHIRRANPRDALGAGRDHEDSVTMGRKHQMVRRGRPFGLPLSTTPDPREMIDAKADSEERGLHFICLVGNISRQFEFVQRNWIQSANFGGLFKDADPLTARRRRGENANDEFTCPAVPVRRKYKGLPAFTTLVGGGYFFLPGLAALRFIARHP